MTAQVPAACAALTAAALVLVCAARGIMAAEVRAVLAQYMPLGDADGDGEFGGLVPVGGARSGSGV